MSSRQLEEQAERKFDAWVAGQLGLTTEELAQLQWSHDEDALRDGTSTGLIISFDEDSDPDLLAKIRNLDDYQVRMGLPPGEPDQDPPPEIEIEAELTIDPALIDRWFSLPPTQALDIELPRVSLDMLYIAIERSYFALAQAVEMVTAQQRGEVEPRDIAFAQMKADVAKGLNSLRRFQTIIMASATNSHLDADGKVKQIEEPHDGK